MHTRYEDLFELYRRAKGDVQRRDYKALVEGGLDLEILDNPSAMAVMERFSVRALRPLRGRAPARTRG